MSEATKLKAPGAAGEVIRSAGEREAKSAARERAGSFGGPRLKLKVFGKIPGYHLYWANDSDGSIEELIHEGFDFVTPAEVGMERKVRSTVVEDKDLDSLFTGATTSALTNTIAGLDDFELLSFLVIQESH